MALVSRILERLAFVVLLFGGIGMMGSMFLGTGDVIGTQFLGWPLPGALELTESTMTLIVFGGLAYAQIRRSHIRVEIVYARVGPRMRAAMGVFAHALGILFFGLLAWQAWGEAAFSIQIEEATDGLIRFPLYPARIILLSGTVLLVVRLVLDVIEDVQWLIEGRDDGYSADRIINEAPRLDLDPELNIKDR